MSQEGSGGLRLEVSPSGSTRRFWKDRFDSPDKCLALGGHPDLGLKQARLARDGAQGGNTGFDPAKKVKGRERKLVVGTLAMLLAVTITASSVQDRETTGPVVSSHSTNSGSRRPGPARMSSAGQSSAKFSFFSAGPNGAPVVDRLLVAEQVRKDFAHDSGLSCRCATAGSLVLN